MTADLNHLTQRLTAAEAGAVPWLWQPLLVLLAQGSPVTVEDLSAVTGRSVSDVRQGLTAMGDTEYDADGRVLGHGLTLVPTAHRFEVAGRPLYTWCALDTVIFPSILGLPARVQSPCHTTGEPVRLNVDEAGVAGVTGLAPEAAVVSLVDPEDLTSVRSAFCNQVHFFASAEAAQAWLDKHPGAAVLPVAEAYQLARPLAKGMAAEQFSGPGPACC
ncbi:organomercurial lyase MerB [Dermatophilaceae bacterium Soc4.6]